MGMPTMPTQMLRHVHPLCDHQHAGCWPWQMLLSTRALQSCHVVAKQCGRQCTQRYLPVAFKHHCHMKASQQDKSMAGGTRWAPRHMTRPGRGSYMGRDAQQQVCMHIRLGWTHESMAQLSCRPSRFTEKVIATVMPTPQGGCNAPEDVRCASCRADGQPPPIPAEAYVTNNRRRNPSS